MGEDNFISFYSTTVSIENYTKKFSVVIFIDE